MQQLPFIHWAKSLCRQPWLDVFLFNPSYFESTLWLPHHSSYPFNTGWRSLLSFLWEKKVLGKGLLDNDHLKNGLGSTMLFMLLFWADSRSLNRCMVSIWDHYSFMQSYIFDAYMKYSLYLETWKSWPVMPKNLLRTTYFE